MKTRRILAASTAALLAFGTTAAYVASAQADHTTYTVTLTAPEDAKTGAGVADADAAKEAVTVAVAGNSTDSPTNDSALPAVAQIELTATENKASDGTTVTGWTISYNVAAAYSGGLTDANASSKPTITIKKAADGDEGGDESGDSLTTTLFVNFNSDGEATLLSGGEGAVKSVKASITDKAAAKFDTDEYEDYKIYGDVDTFDAVGGKVDVSDDQSNGTIKGLDKPLKREIGKIKNTEFAIVNLNIADGDKVKTSTPEPVTFTIRTTFDAKVYHVTGKTVELIKSENAKIVGGNYDVTFTTKNFSPFILTKATLANAGATTSDGTPTSTATSNSGTSTNPDTGIALAIAPVVLAAGAVAVVALKKKH